MNNQQKALVFMGIALLFFVLDIVVPIFLLKLVFEVLVVAFLIATIVVSVRLFKENKKWLGILLITIS